MPRGKALNLASTQAIRSAKQHSSRRSKVAQKARLQEDDCDSTPSHGPFHVKLNTKPMKGELPPFNDLGQWVVDSNRHTIYTYGGHRPLASDEDYTADFFTCDMETLKWRNLTNSLRFHNPHDPFSKESINPRKLELPILSATACTFLHLNGGNFVFFFGGHNATKDRITSDLIAVDVDTLTWWYVKVRGGPINDRIEHSIVAIRNRIYVFGGKKEFDDNAPCYTSYSIAEYSSDAGEWTWVVCDHPYPSHVPSQGCGGIAVSVYDGKKILLSPGRLEGHKSKIELSNEKLVFFHTENHTFQVPAQNSGNLPGEVLWYQSFLMMPSLHKSDKRAAPRTSTSSQSSGSVSQLPSVIFCTWLARPDEYVALELWQYFLPPEEKISCLQLRQNLWDLDLDLQGFVAVGSRFFLLGYKASTDARPEDAEYNICTEIIVPKPNT